MNLHTSNSSRGLKLSSTKNQLMAGLAVFAGALLATTFISHLTTPAADSHAEDLTAVIDSTGYYINLTSGNGGEVNLDLSATPSGTLAIVEDRLNIKSNTPNGYQLYLAMESKEADSNRLYKDGNKTASSYLVPTSGTFDAPAVMDSNAWGYALASGTVGAPSNAFDASYNVSVPDSTAVFAGVPLKGNDQLIQTIEIPDSTNGIDTSIYYGVKANTALPSGSYKGTVTYTAVARTSAASADIADVSPSYTTKLEGGERLTISTPLNIDATTVAIDDVTGTNLTSEGTDLSIIVEVGGVACANIATSNAAGSGNLVIECDAPAHETGKYDVFIRIPKYSKTYTIVNGLTYKYSTEEIATITGGNATAADIKAGKVAFVDGTELTGTMATFESQYDSTKTTAENTADAGLTWNDDNTVLTIAEGWHAEQQVNSHWPRNKGTVYSQTNVISNEAIVLGKKYLIVVVSPSDAKIDGGADILYESNLTSTAFVYGGPNKNQAWQLWTKIFIVEPTNTTISFSPTVVNNVSTVNWHGLLLIPLE